MSIEFKKNSQPIIRRKHSLCRRSRNQGEALYVIRRKTECNHHRVMYVILSQKGM